MRCGGIFIVPDAPDAAQKEAGEAAAEAAAAAGLEEKMKPRPEAWIKERRANRSSPGASP